jgi:hypothetical protein
MMATMEIRGEWLFKKGRFEARQEIDRRHGEPPPALPMPSGNLSDIDFYYLGWMLERAIVFMRIHDTKEFLEVD